jgi:hypothetical protein
VRDHIVYGKTTADLPIRAPTPLNIRDVTKSTLARFLSRSVFDCCNKIDSKETLETAGPITPYTGIVPGDGSISGPTLWQSQRTAITSVPARRDPHSDMFRLPVGSKTAPRFALFAARNDKVSALAMRFPNLIDAEIRTPLDPDVILLVRPDSYVSCTAKSDDLVVVANYLDAIDAAKAVAA